MPSSSTPPPLLLPQVLPRALLLVCSPLVQGAVLAGLQRLFLCLDAWAPGGIADQLLSAGGKTVGAADCGIIDP